MSRDTIRKALSLLAEAGLIQKIHGSGSQVIKHEQIDFPVSQLTSYKELVDAHHINSKTNVIAIDKLIVDEKLAALTGFKKITLSGESFANVSLTAPLLSLTLII